ncbi:MAG: hypothetical protein INF91_05105 [Alphaproteobacteria bacterium]|nr:hypothetical protein [Alphaproteobacteria bacterium]
MRRATTDLEAGRKLGQELKETRAALMGMAEHRRRLGHPRAALDALCRCIALDGLGRLTWTRDGKTHAWVWEDPNRAQLDLALEAMAELALTLGLAMADLERLFHTRSVAILELLAPHGHGRDPATIWARLGPGVAAHLEHVRATGRAARR